MYFSDQARKLGYKIHVHTGVQLNHMGTFVLNIDGTVENPGEIK
jgi:hypothetical protein